MSTPRRVVCMRRQRELPYEQRVAEQLAVGDHAWVSFDGRYALPVTVLEVAKRHYTVRLECDAPRDRSWRRCRLRPVRVGRQHSLFLDEVRSTPQAACVNCVSF